MHTSAAAPCADKTNFTVAVIPMALTYGWSPTVSGLVASAFFYGFLAMQLPGGWLATKLGGAYVLPRGLALWSAATAVIPAVAGDMTALCATRCVDMGHAGSPPPFGPQRTHGRGPSAWAASTQRSLTRSLNLWRAGPSWALARRRHPRPSWT